MVGVLSNITQSLMGLGSPSSSGAGSAVSAGLSGLGALAGGPLGSAIGVGAQLLGGLFGSSGPDPAEMAAFQAEVQRQENEKSRAAQQANLAHQLLTRAGEGRIATIGQQGAGHLAALDRIIGGFRSTL